MSVEPSPTILPTDRSEPIFESHTEGKIRKTMEILTFFANFWLNQIQNCSIRITKMKDEIPRKIGVANTHETIEQLDWRKMAKTFLVNSCRKFLS